MTPNELDLRRTLQEDASRIDAPGDFAAAAIGLDRRRTRRRTTLTAAAAAIAAAVVPILFWSPSGPTGGLAPATNPSASVSATPSATAPVTPAPTATTPAQPTTDAPATATPENIYALDDTLVVAGRTLPLEKGTAVETLSVLSNGGFLLQSHMTTGASQSEIEILDSGGNTVTALGSSGMYAVSADGSRVLVRNGEDDRMRVFDPNGKAIAERRDNRMPAAIVGDFAYLNADSSQPGLEWNYVTGETRDVPSHIAAVSNDRTRAALQWFEPTVDGMDSVCWAVADLTKSDFPRLIERCGPEDNPTGFMPNAFSKTGTYLVGSKYIDGGHWFIPAVFRASDGEDMLGGTEQKPISGWTWRLSDDETSLLISRNTAGDVFADPAQNTVQTCSLAMECTEVLPELPITQESQARYTVPK